MDTGLLFALAGLGLVVLGLGGYLTYLWRRARAAVAELAAGESNTGRGPAE